MFLSHSCYTRIELIIDLQACYRQVPDNSTCSCQRYSMGNTLWVDEHYPVFIRVLERVEQVITVFGITMHHAMVDADCFHVEDIAYTFNHVPVRHGNKHFLRS